MWTFIFVGTFGAIGAALSVGTLAALFRYRRTGEWPGDQDAGEMTAGHRAGLWLRIVGGAVLAGWALVSLGARGLLW